MPFSPKRRVFLLAFAVACFLLFGPYAPSAQDAGQEEGAPPSLALPQHEWLAREAGEWKARCTWHSPDGPVEFEGVERNRMACGGLWLVSDFEADFMGAPFAGHSITGYDPEERSLKSVWVDSGSTRVIELEGSLTAEARVLMARGVDPQTGAEYDEKHVSRLIGPDERVFRMLRVDGEAELPLMEIRYERVAR